MAGFWQRWIGAMTPERPPQRKAAKARHVRRYEAAASGRLTAGWVAGTTGPNTEVWNAHISLRDRSRDLVRNNALATRAITVLTSALVGDGIRPQPRSGSARVDEALTQLWSMLGTEIDAAGRLDVYGLQAQAVRAWLESGEVFQRRRWRRPDDGLLVPMQVQMLEADYLADSSLWIGRDDNERLQYGIEMDAVGRRTAYAMYRQHPGESNSLTAAGLQYVMVPASEVSHVYRADRPGQLRGVPWLAAVMLDLRDLDDLEHTEIVRQKMQACLMAVRKTSSLDPVGLSDQVEQDDDGRWIEDMVPGMVAKLPDGEDIDFFAPQQFGGFIESVQHYQRIVAVGSQVPYELLTGDLSSVNYSSIRAGDLEFRRLVSALCRQVVVPHVCQPVWAWFVEAAELSGMIPQMTPQQRMMAMRPIWHPPRWVAIDREAEIKADILEMQAGTRTLAQAAAERGQDWRSLLAQLAEEQDAAAELGLSLTGFGSKSPSQSVTMPADTAQTPDVEDDTPADDEQADDVEGDANDAEDEDAA
jgi:lambda family phage portal protein